MIYVQPIALALVGLVSLLALVRTRNINRRLMRCERMLPDPGAYHQIRKGAQN